MHLKHGRRARLMSKICSRCIRFEGRVSDRREFQIDSSLAEEPHDLRLCMLHQDGN